jgi:23S rRNA (cytosine1962-C5)-methyltransferase
LKANLSSLKLRVTPDAERVLRGGHPWLFSESIREQNREGQLGEYAVIYDRQDRFLGIGLFDPNSPIRVRMLHVGKPQKLDATWWKQHLDQSIQKRQGLFDSLTTGYRLCHGENDDWPGFVLDRYDTTLVLKLYSAAWFTHLEGILSLLLAVFPQHRIVLRLSRNIQEASTALRDGMVLQGEPLNGPVVFQESGLRFEADVLRGQKTGFFLDQRENRRKVEALSRGRPVLNAFSFSGGFSLYAARGGAKSVTDLDISAHALESAKRNFALNASSVSCNHELIQADAFEWLKEASESKFGLIVLDPPSLAKREAERGRAIEAYERLAKRASRLLEKRGVLVAASCSAHVSAEEFFNAIRHAANESRRRFTVLETTGHPPDHPIRIPEAQYLKCIYLQFE